MISIRMPVPLRKILVSLLQEVAPNVTDYQLEQRVKDWASFLETLEANDWVENE